MNFSPLIARGEGLEVEFKTSFSDETIVSLVAFCNAVGGTVFVGISDTRD